MQSSQENTEEKPKGRKGGKTKALDSQETMSPLGKGSGRSSQPSTPLITEHEFRALVARKAYELYEHRRAVSEVDDWLQAERLVKQQLLAHGQRR